MTLIKDNSVPVDISQGMALTHPLALVTFSLESLAVIAAQGFVSGDDEVKPEGNLFKVLLPLVTVVL